MLNVFIIGRTKCGKTTVAKQLAERLGFRAVSASGWIKNRVLESVAGNTQSLTDASVAALRTDPDACVSWLRAFHLEGGLIIDGIRNPRDFALLFRPDRDVVLSLESGWALESPTRFEQEGLSAIRSFLDFQSAMWFVPSDRRMDYAVQTTGNERAAHFDSLVSVVLHAENLTRAALAAREPAAVTRGVCHVPILLKAWVAERILYDDDPQYTDWVECQIVSVSSYPGSCLTFQVLLDNGSLFSYVPPHRLRVAAPAADAPEPLDLGDLVYRDAPSEHIAVTRYEPLGKAPCWVYFKRRGKWLSGSYIATVDWYTENDLDHVIALDNGQLACLPSHKMLFGAHGPLPPYRALHATWSAAGCLEASQTAAVVVMIRADGRVLGVSRKDDHTDFGLPGGKMEPGELPEEAAARELWEETGLLVDPFKLTKVYVGPTRADGRIAVAFLATEAAGIPQAREAGAVEWITWDVLMRGSFADYNAALKAALSEREGSR